MWMALALVVVASPGPETSALADPKPADAPSGVVVRFFVKTKHNRGKVRCGLYTNQKTWLSSGYISKATVVSTQKHAVCVFENVLPGRYAISAYHDANDNGRLDRNFIGLPEEDFSFSEGARAGLGPPSFKDAAFQVKQAPVETHGRM
ncbi:MAG: DUF2141 domain-containing protein [Myxococcota bacterium]